MSFARARRALRTIEGICSKVCRPVEPWLKSQPDEARPYGRIERDYGFGQFKCLCRNSNVPSPFMVCPPLKYSMAVLSARPSWV